MLFKKSRTIQCSEVKSSHPLITSVAVYFEALVFFENLRTASISVSKYFKFEVVLPNKSRCSIWHGLSIALVLFLW